MRSPQDTLNDAGTFLPSYDKRRTYVTCPRCSATRQVRHQKLRCLGVTIEGDRTNWGCNHCGWTGPEAGTGTSGPIGGGSEPVSYRYGNLRKVRNPRNSPPKYWWQHLNGGWQSGTNAVDTSALLYRIDEAKEAMAAGEPILIVEGEKDVDTCWGLGFAATCNAHGAGKWTREHSEQLRGADLVVLNDNDKPGRDHAVDVCVASANTARSLRKLALIDDWPAMPEGGDITDWMNQGGTANELLELINNAPMWITPETAPAASAWHDYSAWDDTDPPDQEWTVPNLIPAREVCLFSGYGGGGKSTIGLHLCAAHALGMSWLNWMPEAGPAFFIDCEDHINVVWRRLAAVVRHYDRKFSDLISGGLHIRSLHGQESTLFATSDKNGKVTPTPLYRQLLDDAAKIKPAQIVIASSANVYAGSEIDRSQVTQFTGLLAQIAVASGGSVILISHPSLTGMTNKSGISGSTGWHNTVRARMYLEASTNGNGADEQPDHDVRALQFLKNQYGAISAQVVLRYRNGMFLPEPKLTDYEIAAREAKADGVFLALVRRFEAEKRPVSDSANSSSNYAPKTFASEPEATDLKLTKGDLEQAMRRLFKEKRIRVHEWGPPTKPKRSILPT